jgi:hypothetical protein
MKYLLILLLSIPCITYAQDSTQIKAGAKIKQSVTYHITAIVSGGVSGLLAINSAHNPDNENSKVIGIVFSVIAAALEAVSIAEQYQAGKILTGQK